MAACDIVDRRGGHEKAPDAMGRLRRVAVISSLLRGRGDISQAEERSGSTKACFIQACAISQQFPTWENPRAAQIIKQSPEGYYHACSKKKNGCL